LPAEKKPTTGRQRAVTTPLTPTPLPPTIPPELVELFKAALQTLPPNAFSQFLRANWKWVLTTIVSLVLPLGLTTYNAVTELLAGPARIATLAEVATQDRKEVEALKAQVKELNDKTDRLLWLIQTKGGANIFPTTQPRY
jgi:hypothetical protein